MATEQVGVQFRQCRTYRVINTTTRKSTPPSEEFQSLYSSSNAVLSLKASIDLGTDDIYYCYAGVALVLVKGPNKVLDGCLLEAYNSFS